MTPKEYPFPKRFLQTLNLELVGKGMDISVPLVVVGGDCPYSVSKTVSDDFCYFVLTKNHTVVGIARVDYFRFGYIGDLEVIVGTSYVSDDKTYKAIIDRVGDFIVFTQLSTSNEFPLSGGATCPYSRKEIIETLKTSRDTYLQKDYLEHCK